MATQETPSKADSKARTVPVPKRPLQADGEVRSKSSKAIVVEPAVVLNRLGLHRVFRDFAACGLSMLVHLVLLLVLGLIAIPEVIQEQLDDVVAELYEEELEEEQFNVELYEEIETATKMELEVLSASPQIGAVGSGVGSDVPPQLDTQIVDHLDGLKVNIGPPNLVLPSEQYMMQEVPDGALGDERFVAESTEQALGQLTQEVLVFLERGPVLVVWLFDRSESMKDDRREIRARFDQIYEELGITGRYRNDRLATAITSYGGGFFIHTKRGPTSDLTEIRAAIDTVDDDPSGVEMMCQAVGAAIHRHRGFSRDRQMVLILVTDESGEPENNDAFLERAIAEAKSAKCRIYGMGREAAFGYPHVRFLWRDPATKRPHWLPIDRGPETAFPEQMLIDGFSRRWNVFASGFGPYPLTRMARETGGVFFLLPTEETAQRGFIAAKYQTEAMRSYKPDLRAKVDVVADRDAYPLRTVIHQVASDLNPLINEQRAEEIELDRTFSLDRARFVEQVRKNQRTAKQLLQYMAKAEKVLLENQHLCDQEVSPRWRANYDLMLAQLVTYQVRVYEYGIYLEWFLKNPRKDPATKNGEYLVNYDIQRRKLTFAENESLWKDFPDRNRVLEYMNRGRQFLRDVSTKHPGTPWAQSAQWELAQGFGVELVPDYDVKWDDTKKPTARPKDPS